MNQRQLFAATIAATALLLQAAGSAAMPVGWIAEATRAPDPSAQSTTIASEATPLDSLVRAAQSGNVDAMNLLGVLYADGTRVSRDYATAISWFQHAIANGSSEAMNNLAAVYLLGLGVPRDFVNALHWFELAAAFDNVHGMYSVAVMADTGLSTSPDAQLARAMYLRAAEAGFAQAMIRVSDDYATGSGVKRDLVEAYAWLVVALQSGLPGELVIATLSKAEKLEPRLGPKRLDDALMRATTIAATVRARAVHDDDESVELIEFSSE